MTINKKRLTFFDRLVLWFNYAMVIALLIGYLAAITNPQTFWLIAFFGLAYPPVLLANAIFIAYWLLRKSWWVFLSLGAILIGWQVLNNNIGFRLPSTKVEHRDSTMLRVMNYNVHSFKSYEQNNNSSTRHDILQIIEHEQPDVIGFEEFFSKKQGPYAMVDSIKKVLNTDRCYFKKILSGGQGLAVFTKYPVIDSGTVWINEHQSLNQCIYLDQKKNGITFRVYVVHFQSISFQPQDYKYLDSVSKKGKTDMQGSKRIGSKLKHAFLKRSEQVAIVKRHMAACPYPFVVIGDFNDTPSSYAVNEMAKGLKNAFREKGSGLGRTYNGDFPNFQIDYILASKQFNVLTYCVIRKKLSDHYPVYSDLQLK